MVFSFFGRAFAGTGPGWACLPKKRVVQAPFKAPFDSFSRLQNSQPAKGYTAVTNGGGYSNQLESNCNHCDGASRAKLDQKVLVWHSG